jgi:uncharacterized metal-binding protein YceD (DUF177 family)
MSDEFIKEIQIDKIPAKGVHCKLQASGATLVDIASRLDVRAVEELVADLKAEKAGKHITVRGRIIARVEQQCVISLEPMFSDIDEQVDITFTTEDETPEFTEEGEMIVNLDLPEPLEGNVLDLGDLAIQQLSLAIDPYPRKAGAEPVKDTGTQPDISPFAALKELK